MIKAVDPCLRARGQLTVLGSDVVGLAEVVPGNNLDEGDFVPVGNDVLPTRHPEVFITVEDELLFKKVRYHDEPIDLGLPTFLLNEFGPKWVKNQGATAAI